MRGIVNESGASEFGDVIHPAAKRQSAASTSYAWLKDQIVAVPREVGVFISEAEVVAASGTGRTPAREALQRLETEGYLQIIPRKGIYIPPISEVEIRHVMDARMLVETVCAERAIESGALADSRLEEILRRQEHLVGENRPFIEEDRLFHLTIVEKGRNPILTNFYAQLRDRQVRMGLSALTQERNRDLHVLDEHRQIARSIREGDRDAAVNAVTRHLSNTLAALLGGH
jgi:DNA-binding GntR family transcriptional regulator